MQELFAFAGVETTEITEIQVPGVGPKDAKLCIIGEAPGAEEALQRRPFVGASGDLLRKLLAEQGIRLEDCYVTNVIKERPKNNDISVFFEKKRDCVEASSKALAYLDYLEKELGELSATHFLCLGQWAHYALTGRSNVVKQRGSIYPATLQSIKGKKVLSTRHPAAALREYTLRYHIQYDLRKLKKELDFPEVRYPSRDFIIQPSFYQVKDFLNYILEHKATCSVDIETIQARFMSCIGFSTDPFAHTICVPFIGKGGDYWTPPEEIEVIKLITRVLEDPEITKITQNGMFDTSFLIKHYGIRSVGLKDTMIAQRILYPDLPAGLDFLTSVYTDEPYYKDEGKQIAGRPFDFNTHWNYNAKDAAVTLEIFPKLYSLIERQGNTETFNRTMRLFPILLFMYKRGMYIDKDGMKKAAEEARRIDAEAREEFAQICGGINPQSPKALMKYFYEDLGFPVMYTVKMVKGVKVRVPTINDQALKRLAIQGIRAAVLVREIRKQSKLYSTYFEINTDTDGRLRSFFNPVADTGRLTSKATIDGEGMNMQNQPPASKRFIKSDRGYLLGTPDISQAENRIVAYTGPDSKMRELFEQGVDIHRATYALMFGKRIEDVSDEKGSCSLGSGMDSERDWGKKSNHAFNYGLTAFKYSITYELPLREATEIRERYHSVYPGVEHGYWAMIKEMLAKNRTVTNPFGRKRIFLDRWEDELFKTAYSHFAQSTVADLINSWGLIPLYEDQESFGEVEILNQIHDSLVFQFPISLGAEKITKILLKMKNLLEQPIVWRGASFTLPVDFKLATSLFKKDERSIKMLSFDEVAEAVDRILLEFRNA